MASSTLAISMLALAALAVNADVFLGVQSKIGEHTMSKDIVEQTLLSELSALADGARLRSTEEELRPLHAAMPKNEHGKLEPSVVRYALHRYFAQKHGWHVKGLERAGGAWNSTSQSTIMKEQAPSYIQGLFEERLHGEGLGLHELAVFAVTLADLIREQTVGEVEYVYELLEASTSRVMDAAHFDESILRVYLIMYFHGLHEDGASTTDLFEYEEYLDEHFFRWADAQVWAKDLRRTLDLTEQSRRNPFAQGVTFRHAVEFVQEIAHRAAPFHDHECRGLKEKLVDLEHQGTGRVRLSKFYSGSEDPFWPFLDSVEYLRALGALDETDPSRPSVVIPNYIGSQSSCMTPSDFYSVCCLDECEGLLSHVEREIAEPAARPERIAHIVSGLASDTVDAPRNLSTAQLVRLEEIAALHGGHVPLHGRLFAQWMHHAYPRECPFPHLAGTTQPLSPDDWLDEVGLESTSASEEELAKHLAMPPEEAAVEALPWTEVEELVASHRWALAAGESRSWGRERLAALLAAVVAAALAAARASGKPRGGFAEEKAERHLV